MRQVKGKSSAEARNDPDNTEVLNRFCTCLQIRKLQHLPGLDPIVVLLLLFRVVPVNRLAFAPPLLLQGLEPCCLLSLGLV